MGIAMRRTDRKLDADAAFLLLERGSVCHLAMVDQGEPYLVTLNYGVSGRTLYFHAAHEGRKMDILGKGSRVCFTVVPRHELVVAEQACGFSMRYESVVGWGRPRLLLQPEEKRRALGVIMAQYVSGAFSFPDGALQSTAVFAVDIEEISAKRNW